MPPYRSSSSRSSRTTSSTALRRSPRLNVSTPPLPEVPVHEIEFLARLEGMVRQRDAILKVLAERNVEEGVKNEWRGYGERKGVMEWAKEVATAEQRIEEVDCTKEKQEPFIGELEWRRDGETNRTSRSGIILPQDSPYLSFSIAPSAL